MSDEQNTNNEVEQLIFGDKDVENPIDELTEDTEEKNVSTEDVSGFDELETEDKPKEPQKSTEDFYGERLQALANQPAYQKAMELLKQNDPELHTQIKNRFKGQQDDPAPQTKTQSNENYEDDPYLAKIEQLLSNKLSAFEKSQQQMAMEQQYSAEYKRADEILTNFVSEQGVTPEQLNNAYKEVGSLVDINRLGGPTAVTKLLIKELQNQAILNSISQRKVEAGAEAAAKANAIKNVEQPAPGALPEPKTKTKQQKLLEAMQNAGGSPDAASEIFG